MEPQQQPVDGAPRHRSIATITAELAEVERHLREVPPHHGGGAGDLRSRADGLRRELAAARAAHDRDDEQRRRAAQAAQQAAQAQQ